MCCTATPKPESDKVWGSRESEGHLCAILHPEIPRGSHRLARFWTGACCWLGNQVPDCQAIPQEIGWTVRVPGRHGYCSVLKKEWWRHWGQWTSSNRKVQISMAASEMMCLLDQLLYVAVCFLKWRRTISRPNFQVITDKIANFNSITANQFCHK